MSLLETYDLMKQAEQEVEISNEEQEKVAERMEVLAKYAEVAEEALKVEFGEDYELTDVEKLAEMLIQKDLETNEDEMKVGELVEAGQIMAHAFADELQTISDQSEEKSE